MRFAKRSAARRAELKRPPLGIGANGGRGVGSPDGGLLLLFDEQGKDADEDHHDVRCHTSDILDDFFSRIIELPGLVSGEIPDKHAGTAYPDDHGGRDEKPLKGLPFILSYNGKDDQDQGDREQPNIIANK